MNGLDAEYSFYGRGGTKQMSSHRFGRTEAGVFVADAHQEASQGDQSRGGKTESLGPEKAGDGHVASGIQLADRLDDHTAAQIVQQKGLVGFGHAQFPWRSGP